jgi:hypothetical protein
MIRKSKNVLRLTWLALFAAAFCLFLSCGEFDRIFDFDQGLGPSKTRIIGKVIFDDPSTRPRNVEEVRVVAVANLPPNAFGDVYFSNALRFDLDTASYEISAPVGDYPAIGVLWKPRNKDWSFSNILGIYGVKFPFEFELKPIHLTQEQPVADSVEISAYWGFAQFDGNIKGELTLIGAWPANTEIVLLGAFSIIPNFKNLAELLGSLGGLPLPITNGESKRPYDIAVRDSTEYKFVGIFWKGKDMKWEDIRLVGFYRDPQDPANPGAVAVPPNGTVPGINLVADFNTLPDGIKLPGRP